MSANQDTYRTLCQQQNLPVYARDWWWDAVCGPDHWEVCLARHSDGEVAGAMPYRLARKWGQRLLQNPPLTTYQPLFFSPPASERVHRQYGEEKWVVFELLDQLPPRAWIKWQLAPEWTNGLPFFQRGFHLGVRYTYQLRDLSDLAAVHRNMEGSVRTHIRKAKTRLQVRPTDDLSSLLVLQEKVFRGQRKPLPYGVAVLESLHAAIQSHQAGQLFEAVDEAGQPHAIAYVLWGNGTAHFWLSATDPASRSSGAGPFLLWEVIKEMARKGVTFDFEGSMAPGIEPFYRAFGAERQPYLEVFRAGNRLGKALYYLLK